MRGLIISKINATGVSTATFRAITGLEDDKEFKERIGDVIGGYGFGVLFGTVFQAKNIFNEVMRTVKDPAKYFKGIETPDELQRRFRELAKKYHPDSNFQGATPDANKFDEIRSKYDEIMAKMMNKVDVNEVIKVAESPEILSLSDPAIRRATTVDQAFANTMQNGGTTINIAQKS